MDDGNYDKILTRISICCLGHLGSIRARALALIEKLIRRGISALYIILTSVH